MIRKYQLRKRHGIKKFFLPIQTIDEKTTWKNQNSTNRFICQYFEELYRALWVFYPDDVIVLAFVLNVTVNTGVVLEGYVIEETLLVLLIGENCKLW